MGSSAICLDGNQNTIPCSDPNCSYGDCGSTSTQVVSGSLCLDQNQNAVACADPECTYGDCTSPSSGAPAANPVAGAATTTSGGTSLGTSLLNFAAAVTPSAIAAGTGTTTGLRLQTNPATGLSQYYNPATGQYVGSPVTSSGISTLFSGSTGFILIIVALVLAFFAFGGKKRLAAA